MGRLGHGEEHLVRAPMQANSVRSPKTRLKLMLWRKSVRGQDDEPWTGEGSLPTGMDEAPSPTLRGFALPISRTENGGRPPTLKALRLNNRPGRENWQGKCLSMLGEGASSIPVGKLPSPVQGSSSCPRTLFAKA